MLNNKLKELRLKTAEVLFKYLRNGDSGGKIKN